MTARAKPDIRPAFFETADDNLAAYLMARGCPPSGLGIGEAIDPVPIVTHTFDAPAAKLHVLVSSYRDRAGDEVSASAFVSALFHLRTARLDETLRRLRQIESDLAKVRLVPDDSEEGR